LLQPGAEYVITNSVCVLLIIFTLNQPHTRLTPSISQFSANIPIYQNQKVGSSGYVFVAINMGIAAVNLVQLASKEDQQISYNVSSRSLILLKIKNRKA